MTTLIVCLTIIFCVIWVTCWIKHMVSRNLPMFTYGECVWKPNQTEQGVNNTIGFVDTTEPIQDDTESKTKERTDKEMKEALMQDPITLCASLLRGEVDIDDVNT